MKSRKNVTQFKDETFPHFEELYAIFGVYEATGKDAVAFMDVEELEKEGTDKKKTAKEDNDISIVFSFEFPFVS